MRTTRDEDTACVGWSGTSHCDAAPAECVHALELARLRVAHAGAQRRLLLYATQLGEAIAVIDSFKDKIDSLTQNEAESHRKELEGRANQIEKLEGELEAREAHLARISAELELARKHINALTAQAAEQTRYLDRAPPATSKVQSFQDSLRAVSSILFPYNQQRRRRKRRMLLASMRDRRL